MQKIDRAILRLRFMYHTRLARKKGFNVSDRIVAGLVVKNKNDDVVFKEVEKYNRQRIRSFFSSILTKPVDIK